MKTVSNKAVAPAATAATSASNGAGLSQQEHQQQRNERKHTMKTMTKTALALLAVGASALIVTAQDGNPPQDGQRPPRHQGPPGMEGRRLPPPPVMVALDANKDGILDEAEIANASKALLTLDKNGDGKLTREELRPPRPEGENSQPIPRPPQNEDQ